MSAPEERYVCDLRLMMRMRLACGLFNRRAVPLRRRQLAQAYCFTLAVIIASMIYFILTLILTRSLIYASYLPDLAQVLVSQLVSLWTEDEYLYVYSTQNRLTDITLDSPKVFNRLQRQQTQAFTYILIFLSTFTAVYCWNLSEYIVTINVVTITIVTLTVTFLAVLVTFSYGSKFLVMSLFNARLLVLKRRLQRFGFRAVGRAPPQPYCQIYGEILQMLEATNNPLKVLLFFDLIFSSLKLTSICLFAVYQLWWNVVSDLSLIMFLGIFVPSTLIGSFGYVGLLESAATHCEDMAVFTATQLIKTPTDSERQRMREFLSALEHRGARYQVMRALPIDARLVLRALGFCTAQAIVFANTMLFN